MGVKFAQVWQYTVKFNKILDLNHPDFSKKIGEKALFNFLDCLANSIKWIVQYIKGRTCLTVGFRLTQIWRPGATVQCAELQGKRTRHCAFATIEWGHTGNRRRFWMSYNLADSEEGNKNVQFCSMNVSIIQTSTNNTNS